MLLAVHNDIGQLITQSHLNKSNIPVKCVLLKMTNRQIFDGFFFSLQARKIKTCRVRNGGRGGEGGAPFKSKTKLHDNFAFL